MNSATSMVLSEYSGLKHLTGTTLESIQSKTRGNISEIITLTSYRDNQYDWLLGRSKNGIALKKMINEYPHIW